MKQFLVIKRSNLPTRLPLFKTLFVIMALDFWNAATWIWLLVGLFMLWVWVVVAYRHRYQKEYDLFPGSVRDLEENHTTKFEHIVKESSE